MANRKKATGKKKFTRSGAAAFALGIFLAGPQAAVAAADDAEGPSPASSQGTSAGSESSKANSTAPATRATSGNRVPSTTRASSGRPTPAPSAATAAEPDLSEAAASEPTLPELTATEPMPEAPATGPDLSETPTLPEAPANEPMPEAPATETVSEAPAPVDATAPAESTDKSADSAVRRDASIETTTSAQQPTAGKANSEFAESAVSAPKSTTALIATAFSSGEAGDAAPSSAMSGGETGVATAVVPVIPVAAAVAAGVQAAQLEAVAAASSTPANSAAAAAPTLRSLNTEVVNFFDTVSQLLSNLPANPVSEFLSGALLLLRRGLFDQAPTAAPGRQQQTTTGEFEGRIRADDPEGDPLVYEVAVNPQWGSVVISADGQYVYTPGEDFAGTDSFVVKVTDGNGGFNLLDPFGERSAYATIRVPDRTTPFDVGNPAEVMLFLPDATAQLRIEKKQNSLLGTVSLDAPDDTPVFWRDEDGREGSVNVAQVAANWGEIQDSGPVRLSLEFDSGDGVLHTVVLDSVQGAYASGRYVFSGQVASDAKDGPGIDSYYDVIGQSYKPQKQAFLAGLGNGGAFQADIQGARLFMDTYSVQDYRAALAGADPGVPLEEVYAAANPVSVGAAAAVLGTVVTFDQLLDPDVGGSRALQRLRDAISYAQSGKPAFTDGANDPLFTLVNLLPPCVAKRNCQGTFKPINAGNGVVSLAKTSFGPAELSFDFGPDAYGYVFYPSGLNELWDPKNYSLGLFMSLVAGPSATLKLADVPDPLGSGTLLYASSEREAKYQVPTQIGTFGLTAELNTELKAQLGLPAGFSKDKLKAEFYGKAGVLVAYNTYGFPVRNDDPQLIIAKGWAFDPNYQDFEGINSFTVKAKAEPVVTGTYSLGVDTPVGDVSVFKVDLTYRNPLTATLSLEENASPSLTLGSSGTVDFFAGVLPGVAKTFGWEDKMSYKINKEIYNVQTGNLLA